MNWYSPYDTLNKQRRFNYEIGESGNGKTTGTQLAICKKALQTRSAMGTWVRRYQNELEEVQDHFFDDINKKELLGPHHECIIKPDGMGYVDDIPAFEFKSVSTDYKRKGVSSAYTWLMVYDEFIPYPGAQGYLADEVNKFLRLYDTVARPRDPQRKLVQALFLANNVSPTNQYFSYFGIQLNMNGVYMDKHHYARMIPPGQYGGDGGKDWLEMITNTEYGQHAILNKPLIGNTDYVRKRTKTGSLQAQLFYNGKTIGLWLDSKEGTITLSHDINPDFPVSYYLTRPDGTINSTMRSVYKSTRLFKMLKDAWQYGGLYFESPEIQNDWYKISKYLGW